MRTSPLRLKQISFTRVSIEPSTPFENGTPGSAVNFEFEQVMFKVKLDVGIIEDQRADPRDFLIQLGVTVDNVEGRASPYQFDIGAAGYFEMSPKIAMPEREDLAVVNGAGLIYGAMREMVANITARCWPGMLVLPSMNFADHAKHSPPSPQKAKEKPVVARSQARRVKPAA